MDQNNTMTQDQFDQIMARFEKMDASIDDRFARIDDRIQNIEENMVRKSDVFQSVLTVQGFTFAIIVGVVVVLNATVGLT